MFNVNESTGMGEDQTLSIELTRIFMLSLFQHEDAVSTARLPRLIIHCQENSFEYLGENIDMGEVKF